MVKKCLAAGALPQAETERINRPQNSMFGRDYSYRLVVRGGKVTVSGYSGESEKVGEVIIAHEQKSCRLRAIERNQSSAQLMVGFMNFCSYKEEI